VDSGINSGGIGLTEPEGCGVACNARAYQGIRTASQQPCPFCLVGNRIVPRFVDGVVKGQINGTAIDWPGSMLMKSASVGSPLFCQTAHILNGLRPSRYQKYVIRDPLIGVVHLSTLIELLDLFVRTKSTIIGVSFP
jgi:hypothetical protein